MPAADIIIFWSHSYTTVRLSGGYNERSRCLCLPAVCSTNNVGYPHIRTNAEWQKVQTYNTRKCPVLLRMRMQTHTHTAHKRYNVSTANITGVFLHVPFIVGWNDCCWATKQKVDMILNVWNTPKTPFMPSLTSDHHPEQQEAYTFYISHSV